MAVDVAAYAIRLQVLELIVQDLVVAAMARNGQPIAEQIMAKREEMVSRTEAAFEPSTEPGVERGQMEAVAYIEAFWDSCLRRLPGLEAGKRGNPSG